MSATAGGPITTDTQAATKLSLLLDFHTGGEAKFKFMRATLLREAARLRAARRAVKA